MTSRAKPAAATRASTRTKAATQPTTTTRTTRAATTKAPSPSAPDAATAPTVAKKTASRKPLLNRNNSPDVQPATVNKKLAPSQSKAAKVVATTVATSNTDKEPIRAYLRIRPHLGEDQPASLPYLEPLSDTSVRMTDPSQDNSATNQPHRIRLSTTSPSSIYTFSHIFPTSTSQSEFFTNTTLPLVRDLLDGQNGLLFAYGVTNSGKTYSVQGGNSDGSAGILPRTLDVIFNSVEGMHAEHWYRPVRLQGIEAADPSTDATSAPIPVPTDEPALADVLAEHFDSFADTDIDPTALKLDRNYEYSIWLSYAEVYNEKVYDLLHTVNSDDSNAGNKTIRPSFLPALSNPNGSRPLLLTRKALPIKPSPPSDSGDTSSTGKYVAGLRQFRVNSASEAKALLKLGQLHRRVFGTLANSQSSRSHGVVTIKILRNHRGDKNDPASYQTSRLTLVDLAGSERTKHTHTTGDRLKEAGNINKSLMVLGQCMEVMRANQKRIAQSLGGAGRSDTRDVKRGLSVVPFRHSKLTEILMDYFVGEGRAVMIVNVNPYDTGFDENSHVMKFAATAREVCTNPLPTATHRAPSPSKSRLQAAPKSRGGLAQSLGVAPNRRKVTIATGGVGRKASETLVEVVEEDEEADQDEDEGEEPLDPMVDALFEEIEILRMQLVDSEMRCAIVEAETREDVMREMDERMRNMEKMFTRRLMNEVSHNEMKTDAKIDMLHRAGMFGRATPSDHNKVGESEGETTDQEEIETSLLVEEDQVPSSASNSYSSSESELESNDASPTESNSRGKRKQSIAPEPIRQIVPDGPECVPLPSDCEDEDNITEMTDDVTESGAGGSDEDKEEEDSEDDEDDEEEGEDEEWVPEIEKETNKIPRTGRKSVPSPRSKIASSSRVAGATVPQKFLHFDEFQFSSEDEISMIPKSPTKSPVKVPSKGRNFKLKSKMVFSSSEEDAPEDMTQATPRVPVRTTQTSAKKLKSLEQKMNDVSLYDSAHNDSTNILPDKNIRQNVIMPGGQDADGASGKAEVDPGKKKKRQLGKKAVLTEDQIEKVTMAIDQQTERSEGRPIRRMARGAK